MSVKLVLEAINQMRGGVSKEDVMKALSRVKDPELNQDVVSLGFIRNLEVSKDGVVSFDLVLTTPACPLTDQLIEEARSAVESLRGVKKVELRVRAEVPKTALSRSMARGVRNVIAVGSGKGGVGKSTVSIGLALALRASGAKVGLLDADVYGASIPGMMGVGSMPEVHDDKIEPVELGGVKLISMAFFTPPGSAVVWRGPLVGKAIQDFLSLVEWGDLDYLVVDLPPGTGDAPLTLAQSVELTGAIIVTTPQRAALGVAVKALSMFKKLNVEIIGVVENMSYMVCPHCGMEIDVFGRGEVEPVAKKLGVPFLGSIPLDPVLREATDKGGVTEVMKESKAMESMARIARRVAARVSVIALRNASRRYVNTGVRGLSPLGVRVEDDKGREERGVS